MTQLLVDGTTGDLKLLCNKLITCGTGDTELRCCFFNTNILLPCDCTVDLTISGVEEPFEGAGCPCEAGGGYNDTFSLTEGNCTWAGSATFSGCNPSSAAFQLEYGSLPSDGAKSGLWLSVTDSLGTVYYELETAFSNCQDLSGESYTLPYAQGSFGCEPSNSEAEVTFCS